MRSMVGGDKEPVYADALVHADYLAKQQLNPAYKMCGAGDAAIAELVGANRAHGAQDIIIVCGDKNVPTRLRKAPSAVFVTVLPTEKFLDTAEQLGLISDANAAWKKIQ